jgi:phosphogluconate dehydratase
MSLHPVVARVTDRIRERSAPGRAAYLRQVDAMASRDRGSDRLGCANVAHAFAALPDNDKFKVVVERAPNIGIVTAYNDMLSAHAPYAGFPPCSRTRRSARAPPRRWPAACRPCATA